MGKYKGFKKKFNKNHGRDEALIISCRDFLFFLVFDGKKKNIVFKISTYYQHLIIEFF